MLRELYRHVECVDDPTQDQEKLHRHRTPSAITLQQQQFLHGDWFPAVLGVGRA